MYNFKGRAKYGLGGEVKAKAEIRVGTQIRVRARIRGREWNIVEEKSDPAKLSLSSLLTNDHKLFKVKTCRSSCSLANVKRKHIRFCKFYFFHSDVSSHRFGSFE